MLPERGQGADRRSQCRHAVHLVSDQHRRSRCRAFNKGMADSPKPKVMVALGDTWQLGPDVVEAVKESPAVYLALVGPHDARDRALHPLRPLAGAHAGRPARPSRSRACRKLGKGAQPEWLGKKVLAAAGIRVPDGDLARTRGRSRRGRQAHRLSGGAEGAGRGAVAQDRGRRRHAQSRRRGGAARGLGHDDGKRQARRAGCRRSTARWSRRCRRRASS